MVKRGWGEQSYVLKNVMYQKFAACTEKVCVRNMIGQLMSHA